jgi:hypothetical protein
VDCDERHDYGFKWNGQSFKYDPFGRRIYKSSSSATSVYAHDGDNLVEETNATGTVVVTRSPEPSWPSRTDRRRHEFELL